MSKNATTKEIQPTTRGRMATRVVATSLMALEQLWTESADTAAGRAQHERVHTARIERRSGQMNLYELPVFSRSLDALGHQPVLH